MTTPTLQALSALQAALLAHDLYGAGHAALAQHAARAEGVLRNVLSSRASLEILVVDQRVIIDGSPLEGAAILRDHLLARLHRAGVGSIALTSGITALEIIHAVEQIARGGAFPADSPHLRFGRVGIAGGVPAPGGTARAFAADAACARVEAAWEAAGEGDATRAVSLEGVVADICAAVSLGRGALLPLAHVRHHDEYTYLHTVNVGMLSAALAERVGLRPDVVGDITTAALLHDVGKQTFPAEIINKKGALSPPERLRVMQHPLDGARLLLQRPGVPDLAPIVAYEHHMHLNGSGYPRRTPGRTLHLASQLVQLADVYDALRTHRPYRAALSPAEVRDRLRHGAGTIYDADLVTLFLETVAEQVPAEHGERVAA